METGYWPLFRFDPRLKEQGKNPFQLDSAAPKGFIAQYMRNETRFRSVEREYPQRFKELSATAQRFVSDRYARYAQLAAADPIKIESVESAAPPATPAGLSGTPGSARSASSSAGTNGIPKPPA